MKKFLIVAALCLFSLNVVYASNSSSGSKNCASTIEKEDMIEVLYFHGKQRCISCKAIENLTKEVLEADFAKELKDGKIVFKVINISTKEGEKIADKYEVSWSSLYINKWEKGKERRNNMTEFSFSYAKSSPEKFKAGIKEKISNLLK